MYKMVSEFGNEIKIVSRIIERNDLIRQGWHEEKQATISKKENVQPREPKPKEVKASGKTVRTRKNIQ